MIDVGHQLQELVQFARLHKLDVGTTDAKVLSKSLERLSRSDLLDDTSARALRVSARCISILATTKVPQEVRTEVDQFETRIERADTYDDVVQILKSVDYHNRKDPYRLHARKVALEIMSVGETTTYTESWPAYSVLSEAARDDTEYQQERTAYLQKVVTADAKGAFTGAISGCAVGMLAGGVGCPAGASAGGVAGAIGNSITTLLNQGLAVFR